MHELEICTDPVPLMTVVEPRLSVKTWAPVPIGPLTVWTPGGTSIDTVFPPDLYEGAVKALENQLWAESTTH